MAFVIPHNHKRELRAAFASHGWEVTAAEADPLAWWINELWLIKSEWQPVGFQLFVAFVGGPDGSGNPHEGADHVTVGAAPPEHWFGGDITRVTLTPDWPARQKGIVGIAAQLRTRSLNAAD